jgi:hypothetical protein
MKLSPKKKALHDSQRKPLRVKAWWRDFQMRFMGTQGELVKVRKFVDNGWQLL